MSDNDILEQSNLYLSRKNVELKELVFQLTARNVKLEPKTVHIISDTGYDLVSPWYSCSACKDACIPKGAFYCPQCGAEVRWENIT